MAYLTNPNTNQIVLLLPNHIIGRNSAVANTFIEDLEISHIHATIQWTGTNWTIKDVSRNGIWLNGEKINRNAEVPLSENTIINLSKLEHASWKISDLTAPQPLLYSQESPEPIIYLESFNLLPNDEQAEYAIFQDTESRHWLYQNIKDSKTTDIKIPLKHNTTLTIKSHKWHAFIPDLPINTKLINSVPMALSCFQVQFNVSLNEEHITINFKYDGDIKSKLADKTYLYMLLYLARKRIEDAQNDIPNDDQGWLNTEFLQHELQGDETYVNLLIFRLRKSFIQKMPDIDNNDKLIERRRGEIRTGLLAEQIQIIKGKVKIAIPNNCFN